MCILWLREQGLFYEYEDCNGPVMAHWWEHSPRRFVEALLKVGDSIRLAEAKKYDCFLFCLGDEGGVFPSCLGVMIDDRHFLISLKERGSFVAMFDEFWRSKHWGTVRLHKAKEKK